MGLFKKKGLDKFFDMGNVVSVIGPEAYFQGTLTAKGSLRIDGRVEGSISEAQAVVLGATGKVIGDISAESVVIGGEIKGNVSAVKFSELLATSKVIGDIRTGRILIEEGAFFDGHCSMVTSEEDAAYEENREQRVEDDNNDSGEEI